MNDFRYALRLLRKTPASSAAAVATLALGIGANLAVFSLIDRVLLHPLAVPDLQSLVIVQERYPSTDVPVIRTGFLYDDYRRVRDSSTTMRPIAGYGLQTLTVAYGTETVLARVMFVSADFFRVLGVRPVAGRDFRAEEDAAGAPPVAVLSARAWTSRFTGDSAAIGRSIVASGTPVTIVGVAPESFAAASIVGGVPPDLYLPLETARRLYVGPGNYFSSAVSAGYSPTAWVEIVGRLRPGVTVAQASAEIAGLLPAGRGRPKSVGLLEEYAVPHAGGIASFAALLGGAVALTLFIACANLTSLLLARVDERQTEIAVRAALGGSRWRLARHLLVEAIVVAAAGGIAALIVATWIESALSSFELPGRIAIATLRPAFDTPFVAAAVALTLTSALLCGLGPAVSGASGDLVIGLRKQAGGSPRLRTARALVAVQVALCVVLVFGCGVFVRSLSSALAIDVGFDPHRLVVATVNPSLRGYDRSKRQAYAAALVDRIRLIPGVQSVTTGGVPLSGIISMSTPNVRVDGKTIDSYAPGMSAASTKMVIVNVVGADYFSTLRQPLVAGRDFTLSDGAAATPVAIVSESAARRFWPNENPIGHHIGSKPLTVDPVIVAVARDVRYVDLRDDQRAAVYIPAAQAGVFDSLSVAVVARMSGDAASAAEFQRAAAAVDPDVPLTRVRTADEYVGALLMPQRFGRSLLTALGGIALAVTVVGIYGLIACVVARSRRDVGIRIALGADRADILRHTSARAIAPVAVGIAVGCAASLWAGRFVDRFMYGIRGTDATALAVAAAALLASAAIAALLPAARVLKIDPVEALRSE